MEIGISGGSKNTATRMENFYGLNRGRRPSAGELEDMTNMSSNEYPCAAPCSKRESIATTDSEILAVVAPDAAFTTSVDGFTGVAGNAFYYNGIRKTTLDDYFNDYETDLPADCKWEIERMRDMYILNGYNSSTKKSYMFYYNAKTDKFAYGNATMPNMIVMIGNDNKGIYIEALRDSYYVRNHVINYSDGTSFDCGDYHKLYQYAAGIITWKENIFQKYFSIGDELRVEGFRNENSGQYFRLDGSVIHLDSTSANFSIYNTNDLDDGDWTKTSSSEIVSKMVVDGFSSVSTEGNRHKMYIKVYGSSGKENNYYSMGSDSSSMFYAGVTISKKVPVFSHICVHQNRIWGTSPSGSYIYASASDDIFSFSAEDMTNQLAWRMPTDTAGQITNMSSYNGELIAFKQQTMTIISGYSTRNYQMNTLLGIGCIAPESVVVTNKGVMFLCYDGFYIYNGTLPKTFSRSLNKSYADAVSGFDGRKYYASAVDNDGNREVLVYDTLYGLWHREDDFKATGYFRFRDGFYVCDNNTLYKLADTDDTVEWSMTLAQIGDFDLMGINEVWIRAELDAGAEFTVYTDFGDGKWREHTTFREPDGIAVYRSPVRFAHTDSYRVKLAGRGKVVIYGVELVSATGGHRYKERL